MQTGEKVIQEAELLCREGMRQQAVEKIMQFLYRSGHDIDDVHIRYQLEDAAKRSTEAFGACARQILAEHTG